MNVFCAPNRVGARPDDVRAQTHGHIPDPKKAPKHPAPVGSLARWRRKESEPCLSKK
jgi:hypothetical protein